MAYITTASGEKYYATRDSSGVYRTTGVKVGSTSNSTTSGGSGSTSSGQPSPQDIARRIQQETYSNGGTTFRGTGQSTAQNLPTTESDLPVDQSQQLTSEQKRQAVLANRQTLQSTPQTREAMLTAYSRSRDPLYGYTPQKLPDLRSQAEIAKAKEELKHAQISAIGQSAKAQGYSIYIDKKVNEFNTRWNRPEGVTEGEYAQYEQERAKLESEITPFEKDIKRSSSGAVAQTKRSIDLVEQINNSIPQVGKSEYYAKDEAGYGQYIGSQIGEGYIGGLFKAEDRNYSGSKVMPISKISLSEPAKVIITDVGVGTVIGGIPGAIGGGIVAVGDLSGRYGVIASEKYNFPGIGQATRRVQEVERPDFVIPFIDRKVYVSGDRRNYGKSTIEPAPEFDFQLGLELTQDGGVKVSEGVLIDKKQYRTVSKTEDISKRVQLGGELGAIGGMIIAPDVTRFGMEKLNKIRVTTTDAGAVIEQGGAGETRYIASRTEGKNILLRKTGQPVGSRKISGELATITDQQAPATVFDKQMTGAVKEKVFGSVTRTGSPIRYSGEFESAKSLTIGDKTFGQVFKTTTATPTGTNTAYGLGYGTRIGDITSGQNIGIVLESGKPPGVYNLVYKVKGFTSSPIGELSGGWKPSFIAPQGGSGAITSTAERTATAGFVGTPRISSIDLTSKTSMTLGTTAGGTQGLGLTLSRAPPAISSYAPPATIAREGVAIQKQRIREQITPQILQVSVLTPSKTSVRARGVTQDLQMAVIPSRLTAQRSAVSEAQTVSIAEVTQQTPAVAEITQITPIITAPTLTTPGIPPMTVPPLRPFVPPPVLLAPNIPLGRWGSDLGGSRGASKRVKPRYAPSVTASALNIFTTKKQKSTGWTGFEVRPLVVPGIGKTKKKKSKKRKK